MTYLTKKIKNRNPFKIKNLPEITKAYRWAMEKQWSSSIEQLLFGMPIYILFFLTQRVYPFKYNGNFTLNSTKDKTNITFNAKNTQFDAIYKESLRSGYEPEVTNLLDVIIPNSGTFIDIGSNWGYFSLFVASRPNFKGTVHAFEPFPSTYNDLVQTISQTEYSKKIICHPIALSDHNGQSNMQFSGLLHSGFAYISKDSAGSLLSPKAVVEVKTLDSLKIQSPAVIKIDAQFHEAEILSGAKNIIEKNKPMIIMENCIDFISPDITINPLKELEEMGYLVYFPSWLKEEILIPSEADQQNLISNTLALIPFKTAERFLYRDSINLFACHKSKLKDLEKIFNQS